MDSMASLSSSGDFSIFLAHGFGTRRRASMSIGSEKQVTNDLEIHKWSSYTVSSGRNYYIVCIHPRAPETDIYLSRLRAWVRACASGGKEGKPHSVEKSSLRRVTPHIKQFHPGMNALRYRNKKWVIHQPIYTRPRTWCVEGGKIKRTHLGFGQASGVAWPSEHRELCERGRERIKKTRLPIGHN